MGPGHPKIWSYIGISQSSTSSSTIKGSSTTPSFTTRGSEHHVIKGSCRKGSLFPERERILFPVLPGEEEDRRVETHFRPEEPQQIPYQKVLPHGYTPTDSSAPEPCGFHDHFRSSGRVLPRPHSPQTSQISPFYSGRRTLPICCFALRPSLSPEGIYEISGSCRGPSQAPRSRTVSLPGRLADKGSFLPSGLFSNTQMPSALPVSRSFSESPQVQSPSFSKYSVPRSYIGHKTRQGIPIKRETTTPTFSGLKHCKKKVCFSENIEVLSGDSFFSHPTGTSGPPAHATHSGRTGQTMAANLGIIRRPHISDTYNEAISALVDALQQYFVGAHISSFGARLRDNNRCFSRGLGCASTGSMYPRQMASVTRLHAHQLPRAKSYLSSVAVFPPKDQGLQCSSQNGQYHLHALSKQAGWDSVLDSLAGGTRDMEMASCQ